MKAAHEFDFTQTVWAVGRLLKELGKLRLDPGGLMSESSPSAGWDRR
jgi:hypothetical protein